MARRATKCQRLSRFKKNALEKEFEPEQIVYPGDRISLGQIDPGDSPRFKMRDVVQRELVRLVLIEITRTDGTISSVETPLRFFSRRASNHMNSIKDTISQIRTTVRNARNTGDVRRIAAEAETIGATIHSRIDQHKQESEASEIEGIVSLSILLGQLWAKAETATTVEPLAERAQQSQLKSREGGIKSGKTRRNAPWKQITEEMAIDIRQNKPSSSQDVVADEILVRWKKNDLDPPGHARLKKLVADMEKSGDLPRRRPR